MTTIAKLYDILRKRGLHEGDIQQFLRIIEDFILKGLTTKNDLKDTEINIIEELKNTEIKSKEEIENAIKNLGNPEVGLVEKFANIKKNLRNMGTRLNEELRNTQNNLIKWLIGLMIAQIIIIISVLLIVII